MLSGLCAGAVQAAAPGLAQLVPADARLYLEVRDWSGLRGGPAADLLSDLLESLAAAPEPGTQVSGCFSPPDLEQGQLCAPSRDTWASPVRHPDTFFSSASWTDRLAAHIGLTHPGMLDLLASGKLAVAADGWDALGEAILIAQPAGLAEMERLLEKVATAPARGGLRRYRLANQHELAFDGSAIVIGRNAGTASLYARTVLLWTSRHGVALSDTADFRDRVKNLPARCQCLFYATGRTRRVPGAALPALLWPGAWNQLQSLAGTLTISPGGLTIETSVYPQQAVSDARPGAAPLLAKLPASTLLAWCSTVDYAAHYRRMGSVDGGKLLAFYQGVLEKDLPRGSLETGLLAQLQGETLFVLSQVVRPLAAPVVNSGPASGPADGLPSQGEPLWIPAFTAAVRAARPAVTATTVEGAFRNLLVLLNVQPPPSGPLRIENVPIGPGGGTIQSIAVGRLLVRQPGGEILGQLQLSWTLSEGLLVVGTAVEGVRELILACRGQTPLLTDPLGAQGERGGNPRTVMVAQPALISELLASWAQSFAADPALLLASDDWWSQLRSVRALSLHQLGAIPGRVSPGAIQIALVAPDLPAGCGLQAGDTIVAVEGQPLDAADALGAAERLLAGRPRRDAVTLTILREGRTRQIELPMAPPPPAPRAMGAVEFLGQASRVLRLFAGARYSTCVPEPGTVTARLELAFAPASASRQGPHR